MANVALRTYRMDYGLKQVHTGHVSIILIEEGIGRPTHQRRELSEKDDYIVVIAFLAK